MYTVDYSDQPQANIASLQAEFAQAEQERDDARAALAAAEQERDHWRGVAVQVDEKDATKFALLQGQLDYMAEQVRAAEQERAGWQRRAEEAVTLAEQFKAERDALITRTAEQVNDIANEAISAAEARAEKAEVLLRQVQAKCGGPETLFLEIKAHLAALRGEEA